MASSIALGNISGAAAKPVAGARLSIGLSAPTYYNGFCPFLNWWKQGGPLQVQLGDGRKLVGLEIWDAGTYLDASTGEVSSPVPSGMVSLSRIFFTNTNSFQQGIGCDFSGEEFSVVWKGSAEVRIDFLTAGGSQETVGSNQIRFKMGLKPGNTAITLTFTDANNPPREISIYQTRYARNVLDGEILNPDWVKVMRKFGVIRCMDWSAVNNSTISNFSQLADLDYCSWAQPFRSVTSVSDHGTRGGVHPEILCELARATGANIHVCIPHRATDEFVTLFARYFRDHANVEVTYELSNECWNSNFAQCGDFLEAGSSLWPDDPLRSYKYYGYRASACMNIVRNIYGDSSRWRGALATQTVNVAVTQAILSGVEYWTASNPERRLAVADLFKSLYVTGYFGDVTTCTQPHAITLSNPGVVTSPRHGYETGQTVRCFFFTGMTELDQRDVTVRKIDDDHYTIGVDTSDFNSYVGGRNYVVPSALFYLMERSRKKCVENPGGFPTPYTYFNQQISLSLLEGKSDSGIATTVSVAALLTTHWPAQLSLAIANGMTLRQYEGGCHLVGDAYLTAYGGNSQYTEYLLNLGNSREIAAVYTAMYQGFLKLGGYFPNKYSSDGLVSQFGSWAGVRYWPTAANQNSTDTTNPVWQATLAANQPKGK